MKNRYQAQFKGKENFMEIPNKMMKNETILGLTADKIQFKKE